MKNPAYLRPKPLTGGQKLAVVIVALVLSFALALLYGWTLMLILGGISHGLGKPAVALGFWLSVLIAYGISFVGTIAGLGRTSK